MSTVISFTTRWPQTKVLNKFKFGPDERLINRITVHPDNNMSFYAKYFRSLCNH